MCLEECGKRHAPRDEFAMGLERWAGRLIQPGNIKEVTRFSRHLLSQAITPHDRPAEPANAASPATAAILPVICLAGRARPCQPHVVRLNSVRLPRTASAAPPGDAGVPLHLCRRHSHQRRRAREEEVDRPHGAGAGWLGAAPQHGDDHSGPIAALRDAGRRRRMERFTDTTSGGTEHCSF